MQENTKYKKRKKGNQIRQNERFLYKETGKRAVHS